MNIENMNLEELNARMKELRGLIGKDDSDLDAISEELDKIEARKKDLKEKAEKRSALATRISNGEVGVSVETGHASETAEEKRAKDFIQSGKTTRALLSTGTIAKPTRVGGISGLASEGISIVDDVNAFALTGNGAWTRAYRKTNAAAADITDGSAIGGTGSTFGTVTINPAAWGITDEISNQVQKMTPLNYEAEIANTALMALRTIACKKIVDAVKNSTIAETITSKALDADYLRDLVLSYKPIAGMGGCVLYLNQEDLGTLGHVRGTSEKKPLYTIEWTDQEGRSGRISEGGFTTTFRVLDNLEKGVQLYGQPRTIDMPMWDNYRIETNDSEKFSENKIVIRGVQTANADLTAYHGMQIIKQAGE